MPESTPGTPSAAAACFHCGLRISAGPTFGFAASEGWRAFCCAGCEAVSHAISGLGLDDYYRLREASAERPQEARADALEAFDDALVQASFVHAVDGELEAQLVIEGMRCAACAWLLEHALAREAGVTAFEVQFTTRRARLRWKPQGARLSHLLGRVRAIGYRAWPHEPGRLALVEAAERRSLAGRLWVAGLAMMQVMMYAVPVYLAGEGEITSDIVQLMRWAGLVLSLPVMAYSASPFFVGAWRDLAHGRAGMDVPVAIGLGAAFAGSAAATFLAQGEVYFDSIAMFVFFLLGARYLELVARERSGDALRHLARLVPKTALRLDAESQVDEVPAVRLQPGERVLVRSGETVPADGTLESGTALLGEAWLSGESRAVARSRGERVLEGAVNAGSAFVVRVERVGEATALSTIQRMMERALSERPRWIEASQLAAYRFVALVLVAAAVAGMAWLAIDPDRAPWVVVSVLVVTCPCALALAAPMAVTAASGALARSGFVVSRASAIEALAGVTDVVLDKTGTLTHGSPRLLQVVPLGTRDSQASLALAARLARWSSHPIDRGLVEAAGTIAGPDSESHRTVAGSGIEGSIDGKRVRLGRAAFVQELHGATAPIAWIRTHDTTVFLGDEQGWIAGFRLGDELRPRAREMVAELRAAKVRVHLASGDEREVADAIARALGIEDVVAPADPSTKLAYVRTLQRCGLRVAMVGDGINDAPVLAQADVSIAMGSGADLAQVRADAVLLSDSLGDLAAAFRLARKARRVMHQNLAWALAYNLVAIPVAVTGGVTPLVAGLGMAASSLLVVANASRLRPQIDRWRHQRAIPPTR